MESNYQPRTLLEVKGEVQRRTRAAPRHHGQGQDAKCFQTVGFEPGRTQTRCHLGALI